MQQPYSVSIYRFMLLGLLGCIAVSFAGRPHYGEAQGDQRQTEGVCHGFVILPNGLGVLSGLPAHSPAGSAGAQHGAAHAGATTAEKGHMSGTPQHLMGHTHGEAIVPQAGMLCVSVGSASTLTWTAVGHDPALTVNAES